MSAAGGQSSTPVEIVALKRRALEAVDGLRSALIDLSHEIHARPELAFEERFACERLVRRLGDHGFTIENPYCDLPTAFRAEVGAGDPCVAIIAEYDALPGIGHACGHNVIAACAAGAGIAAAGALAAAGLRGRVAVIGTPAEEVGGGKAILIERGAFADVAAAMMVHPSDRDIALVRSLAMIHLEVSYRGRASHAAAAPSAGVNALDAMVIAYNSIGLLRQQVRETARIHGIITDGGKAPNIIPDSASGAFMVRAEGNAYLAELQERVLNCLRAAATATGCEVDFSWAEAPYLALNTNPALAAAYASNMRTAGRTVSEPTGMGAAGMGSTDMGNVSWVVPSIHPSIAVGPRGVPIHTLEFGLFAGGEGGDRAIVDGAKAIALTAIDVLTQPDLVAGMRRRFDESLDAARDTGLGR